MADIKLFFPKLLKHEGGWVNDKDDKGGATKYGVTLAQWREIGFDKDGDGDIDANDIRILSELDALFVLKVAYWDRWRADNIKNQSIAELLVDWTYNSGAWGVKIPQRILGVVQDGHVGMKTISAVNAADQKKFFEDVKAARIKFFRDIAKSNPTQGKFLNGWLNRVNSFKFIA